MASQIILGIDPGSTITGYGLVRANGNKLEYISSGIIKPLKKPNLHQRLKAICSEVQNLIREHQPQFLAIESIFYAKNVKSLIALSHVRGALLLCALQNQLEIFEYSPLEIKQASVGYGRATKEQVASMVRQIFPPLTSVSALDETDALAAAVCHSAHWKTAQTYAKAAQ